MTPIKPTRGTINTLMAMNPGTLEVQVHPKPYLKPLVREIAQFAGYRGDITWVVVKIMVHFWIPIVIRRLIFRVPKQGP